MINPIPTLTTRSAAVAFAILFASSLLCTAPARAEGHNAAEASDAESKPEAKTEAKTETKPEAKTGGLPQDKFAFDMMSLGDGSRIDASGNRRPIHYEYCIPKRPEAFEMVSKTDPLGQIVPRDKGTIGCSEDELLATGHTGQPDYLFTMREIAKHDFVKKIIILDVE
jgi:hypothetical protein